MPCKFRHRPMPLMSKCQKSALLISWRINLSASYSNRNFQRGKKKKIQDEWLMFTGRTHRVSLTILLLCPCTDCSFPVSAALVKRCQLCCCYKCLIVVFPLLIRIRQAFFCCCCWPVEWNDGVYFVIFFFAFDRMLRMCCSSNKQVEPSTYQHMLIL